jgi:hypothetical protein
MPPWLELADTTGLKPVAARRTGSSPVGGTVKSIFELEDFTQPVIHVCTQCGYAMNETEHCGYPTQAISVAVSHNYDKDNLWNNSKGYTGRKHSTLEGEDRVYHAKLTLTWERKSPEDRVKERAHRLLGEVPKGWNWRED